VAIGWDRAWRATVDEWIEAELGRHGLRPAGEIEQVKLRSWSLVLRVPAQPNQVWFKAGGPGCAYEAGLVAALAGWAAQSVLLPLASTGSEVGCCFRMRADPADHPGRRRRSSALERLLPFYGQLQRDLERRVDAMLELGVPDLRPSAVPGALAELLADTDALLVDREDGMTSADRERLLGCSPMWPAGPTGWTSTASRHR
jgi:hypothetical protein